MIEKELGREQFDLEAYKQSKDKKFPNKEILIHGLEKKDQVCSQCVDFQLAMLQNFVGDLICFTLPLSGMYLIGSIVSSYRSLLKELDFMVTIQP